MTGFLPYSPRPIRFHGIRVHGDFRLKLYSIHYGTEPFDWVRFEQSLLDATGGLPSPAVAPGRAGVGFLIAHQGRGDYVVLGWWDNQNELPLRVFVREAGAWRQARGSESVCVWDLQVIWHERGCYVDTILNDKCDNPVEEYLKWTLSAG